MLIIGGGACIQRVLQSQLGIFLPFECPELYDEDFAHLSFCPSEEGLLWDYVSPAGIATQKSSNLIPVIATAFIPHLQIYPLFVLLYLESQFGNDTGITTGKPRLEFWLGHLLAGGLE